jgi:hypothetical protein
MDSQEGVEVVPLTIAAVDTYTQSLPGVTVGRKWNHRTWLVGDKGFAWERPFSKADLGRFGDTPPPRGDIVAVIVEDLDAKDALLAIAPAGFFTIPHFAGYPAILVELRVARADDVRAAILAAHRIAVSAKRPAKRRSRSRRRK